MKIVGSVREDLIKEKRISITPETVKKFISEDLSINLEKSYAEHLGINDDEFKKNGANINFTKEEVFKKSDIILKVNAPTKDELELIKDKSILIGQFDPKSNKSIIEKLLKKDVKIFLLNLLPRITRAQSMDVLSSQANLAGYKAVLESFSKFEKAIPMMMTAAGTIPAAKVLVIGAGVAGLQAIATAKRMGAIVFATDVRSASKEQVESLGGKFLEVEGSENLETEGGYAKEASEDFKKKQETLLTDTLKKVDIVICTALIPGKKAPLIIKESMIKNMNAGTLIYDLAAAQGGNAAFTEVDKVVEINGIKIIGERNILNKLPVSASNLYAKNLFNFVLNLYDKKDKIININLEDEIIEKTLIK
jgi:H+-translocating NAD(P) transhydrogenase subunit alpha